MEAVECGAAALGIVLSYYGLIKPLEELRQECGVNRDGSNAGNVLKAARRLGMKGRGFRCDAEDLGTERMPLIIHWNFNHFLVLEGFKKGRACLNDPAIGHRTVAMEEFRKSFTGVALSITPDEGFKKGGKKFSITKNVAQKLSTEKAAMLFVMLIGLMMTVPGLAGGVFNQIFIDEILTMSHADWITSLLFAMGAACFLDGSFTFLRAWCLTKWQTKLTLLDSSRFFQHVIRLPMVFFQQRFSGEIAMRVSFNEEVANVLTGEAATAVLDLFVTIFYLVLLIQYSPRLTAIGVSFSLMNLALLSAMRKRLLEMAQRIQQSAGKAMGVAISGIQVIETLKANGNEADFFAKWSGYAAKFAEERQSLALASQVMTVGPAFLNAINTALIMIVGGFEIMDGMMTTGIFMAFRGMMDNFQAPLGKLLHLGQSLQRTEMQVQKLDDVLRYDIDRANYPENEPAAIGIEKLSGKIEMKDVTFGYSPLQAPLIEGFSLTLLPGKWVALVGDSGSGKSTVARIVSGLYKEWSGAITFDGLERKDIPRDVIANSIACVDQEIYLFSGTVRENLSLFNASTPNEDILRGAKDAVIHDDITNLKSGYEHFINEGGANFSGGQRQRLEIARALASNPSLLIFDEATSALDPITEESVLTNIRRRGCACLMVAHRLSAFRDCDEIIVLQNGKIAQRGTHSEMIQTDGPYRRLVSGQTGAGSDVNAG
jgi:NHLM bacteriocin system ABC transporter peptidase/ATP-binding protein